MLNTYSRQSIEQHFSKYKRNRKLPVTEDKMFVEILNNVFPVIDIPENILLLVDRFARHLGFTLAQLRSTSRKNELSMARAHIAYYLRHYLQPQPTHRLIGIVLGSRDHSTAQRCLNVIENLSPGAKVNMERIMSEFTRIEMELNK